jgi:hypothetical protein
LAYKVSISDGTVLQECIEHVNFNVDTSNDYNSRHTNVTNSMIITGKIDTEEGTTNLYKWALLSGTNPDCYKSITVEYHRATKLLRQVSFSKAFVIDYTENYSNHAGTGTFTLYVRQLQGKEIEITSEEGSKNTATPEAPQVKETVESLQQKVAIVSNVLPLNKKNPNITDKLAEKKKEIQDTPKLSYLPKNNGKWSGEEGNSEWIPDPDFVPKNPKSNPEQLSWKQISAKYGVSSILFVSEQPDFSPISKGTVEIKDFSSERDDNFDSADEELAVKRGCTKADVRRWRKKNKYTWHERKDCKTMDKVPTCVHGNITHSGGISETKKRRRLNGEYYRCCFW